MCCVCFSKSASGQRRVTAIWHTPVGHSHLFQLRLEVGTECRGIAKSRAIAKTVFCSVRRLESAG